MRFISWNVNGLRAVIGKGFYDFFKNEMPDFLALQETKMQPGQAEIESLGYHMYWNSAIRKGYSGTLIFAKEEPINVVYGMNGEHNDEGRLITLEYEDFYFVTCYTPNSKEGLLRIDYRCEFEDALREYLTSLKNKKHVIFCGDLNVAHNEIDLKNPNVHHFDPGFSDQERDKFTRLLDSGFSDTFRSLYPERVKYSWWSYRANARANNAGWRIDYFVVDNEFMDKVDDSLILNEVYGSDHCPVELITK
ncbi:MAG: exodeoxyribonuclease III [Gammaproteobacteria bacterium]|nr:exodeoxyribonuclease III [Gammaproteobacteria bacterium]